MRLNILNIRRFNGVNIDYQAVNQRKMIERMTGLQCIHTNLRINKRNNKVEKVCGFDKNKPNAYDYLPVFDGILDKQYKDKVFVYNYINLNNKKKYIEFQKQYHLIEEQYKCLKTDNTHIFLNIFNQSLFNEDYLQFNYLSRLPEYKDIYYKCFIGDLSTINNWISQYLKKDNNF